MSTWVDTPLVLVALTGLLLVASSRLTRCIRIVAFQGALLGVITVAVHQHEFLARPLMLAAAIVALKGAVFPWLLSRVLREADVRREVEPIVGYISSLLLGTLMLAISFRLSAQLPLPTPAVSSLVVPVALFTTFIGLFLIVSRRTALMQVLAYVVLENGIYVFGVGLVQGTPILVELGVLLDVFVAVFVMGIAIFRINREFDHIDTEQLTLLTDWMS
ncbi:MAG TPA: hydrogenase [Candidatus Binatia bacterium]|nr:hydrogenase [Candidatus Binatia bacterium]